MSDNKYIIDENSLVGIANAIRDKLGVGTGIDDEEAGYYSAQIKMLGFTQPGSSITQQGSGSGYKSKTFVSCSASAIENIGGIRPSYVRVTLSSVNATSDRISSYDSTTGTTTVANFTNGVAILSLPDNINNYSLTFELYYYNSSGWTQYLNYPPFDVAFLDENQEVIDISDYSGESFRFYNTRNFLTGMKDFPIPYSIEDMKDKVTNYLEKPTLNIDYQGLSYSCLWANSYQFDFGQDTTKSYWTIFIPLTSGQKVGFCIGETVSNKLRGGFFQGKAYSDFQQYITQPASRQINIYTGGVNITGTTELSGDGLLKRFYYTAPSDGELIVETSSDGTSAPLHVWRA